MFVGAANSTSASVSLWERNGKELSSSLNAANTTNTPVCIHARCMKVIEIDRQGRKMYVYDGT